MRVSRFFADQPLKADSTVVISGQRAHYIRNVLRLRAKDACILFNGEGGSYHGEIVSVERNETTVEIYGHDPSNHTSNLPITLGIAVLKRDAMDTAIQKAVELGAEHIVPLITERTSQNEPRSKKRQQHWQGVAVSACEQCGRNLLPTIDEATPFNAYASSHSGFICTLANRAATLPHTPAQNVSLLIGPEGGFTPQEVTLALEKGWQALGLGPRILRAETAAIAAISLVQARWGDLS